MMSFSYKFPALAGKETLEIPARGVAKFEDGAIRFEELFCEEDGCDCRRALILARGPVPGSPELATLSYGWEDMAFYAKWTPDPQPDRDMQGVSLDPICRQTRKAPALKALFEEALRDPAYVERIKRHYRLFKASVDDAAWELTIPEILVELERNHGRFPAAAVRGAAMRGEDIAPHLLAALDDTCARAEALAEDPDRMLHVYALFLLAQFRDTRAYPLVIRFARLPGELLDVLAGEAITGVFHRVLASVCGGDTGPIRSLIEDPSVDELCRAAALDSLNTLVFNGALRREEVVSYHRFLLRGGIEKQRSLVWDTLAFCATALHPGEVLEDIRQALQAGMIDPDMIDEDGVEQVAAREVDAVMDELRADDGGYVEDAVKEMERWACFEPGDGQMDGDDADEIFSPRPYVRPDAPIGRNDPCPCGSGLKHKKCCGKK